MVPAPWHLPTRLASRRSKNSHEWEVAMLAADPHRFSSIVGAVLIPALALGFGERAHADDGAFKSIAGLSSANPAQGVEPTRISPGLILAPLAKGTDPIENPSGVITRFGLLSDQTKTEP